MKLYDLLQPERLTEVVDIGANPLDGGPPPYKYLLDNGICRIVGFEPHEMALKELQRKASQNERYLPNVVSTWALLS